jgi:hypothetical protein
MLNGCLASMYICIGTFDGLVTFVGRLEPMTYHHLAGGLTWRRHLGIFLLLPCGFGALQDSEGDKSRVKLPDVDDKPLHLRLGERVARSEGHYKRPSSGRGDWASDRGWMGRLSDAIFRQRLGGAGFPGAFCTLCILDSSRL